MSKINPLEWEEVDSKIDIKRQKRRKKRRQMQENKRKKRLK
tara:strand:- start:126 stop:248 length:123 start_codon:yes stop_codon:yes gene_type:complete